MSYIPPHRRRGDNQTHKKDNYATFPKAGSSRNRKEWALEKDVATASTSTEREAKLTPAGFGFTRICCMNLKRREDRWKSFVSRMNSSLLNERPVGGISGKDFIDMVERYEAVDGAEWMKENTNEEADEPKIKDTLEPIIQLTWDASKDALYDRHIRPPMTKIMTPGEVGCALSHIGLWKEFAHAEEKCNGHETSPVMLILEDDAVFFKSHNSRRIVPPHGRISHTTKHHGRDNNRNYKSHRYGHDHKGVDGFMAALLSVWKVLPSNWDILYLGFSDRGERNYIHRHGQHQIRGSTTSSRENIYAMKGEIQVELFRPTYGFHTHAYALRQSAANVLLANLPVSGPLDVWLADNDWFELNVYCSIVATAEDHQEHRSSRTSRWQGKDGIPLVSQRKHGTVSDIGQSGRTM